MTHAVSVVSWLGGLCHGARGGQRVTCLRRCTGHTDRRNSRRCSRSRRNSTPCRSQHRYHSRRRSRRYSRCHSGRRSRCRSFRRRSRRKSRHSLSRSSGRTSRRSSTCSRCCMHRHSWSRRYPNPGTCTHRCEQKKATRASAHGSDGQKRGLGVGAGRPAAGATRSQLPPSAPAVDFARDRRVVRRERGRVVRLVVRWEHPAVGRGEHHREVDEHRILWSLHLFECVVSGAAGIARGVCGAGRRGCCVAKGQCVP